MADSREVQDVRELLDLAEIDNVVVHEERARRITWADDQLDQQFPLRNDSFGFFYEDQEMHFRFRSVFADRQAEYVADVEVVYRTEDMLVFDDTIHREFAERVAFMAVYPFIRASVFASAGRLNLPAPILGMVRQGEFSLGERLTEDQALTAFGDVSSEFAERLDPHD